jgi:hypothetical protein
MQCKEAVAASFHAVQAPELPGVSILTDAAVHGSYERPVAPAMHVLHKYPTCVPDC